jgi:cytochrome P450
MISGKRYYGEDAVALEGKEFQILMNEYIELLGSGNLNDFFPILKWIDFQGKKKKMVKLMKKMDCFLQKLLDEKRRNWSNDQRNMTLIDVMLDLQQKEPEFYTHEIVKGVILVMLVAGSETSATTMEWALSLLLNHPEKMNKVKVEIDTYLRQDQLMNESDSLKLNYLQKVIMETLRLYPVAPLLIPHESSNDCNVCGFNIPKGTMLLVNLWTLHRDPNIWINPTWFVPERFEGGELSNDEIYNMLPFGIGRRSCPGSVLAKRFMGHALGSLIQSFEWERIEDEKINISDGIGLTMPKLEPLVALCKPRQAMIKALSNM